MVEFAKPSSLGFAKVIQEAQKNSKKNLKKERKNSNRSGRSNSNETDKPDFVGPKDIEPNKPGGGKVQRVASHSMVTDDIHQDTNPMEIGSLKKLDPTNPFANEVNQGGGKGMYLVLCLVWFGMCLWCVVCTCLSVFCMFLARVWHGMCFYVCLKLFE